MQKVNSLDDIELKVGSRCKGLIAFDKQLKRRIGQGIANNIEEEIIERIEPKTSLPAFVDDNTMTEKLRKKDAKMFQILNKIKTVMIKQNMMD